MAGNGHNLSEVAKATADFVAECDEAVAAAPKGAAKTVAKATLAYAQVGARAFARVELDALALRQAQVKAFPPVKGEKPSAEARASAGSHASTIVDAFQATIAAYEDSLVKAKEEKSTKRAASATLREQVSAEQAAASAIAEEKFKVTVKTITLEQAVEMACAAIGREAVIELLVREAQAATKAA
jgi:hypothetical protein